MSKRVLIWIPGDQLLQEHPALEQAKYGYGKDQLCVVLVESKSRIEQLPYNRKKLVLLLSAMRHYVDWLKSDGYDARYIQADSVQAGLQAVAADFQPDLCLTMAASEYHGRHFQQERLAATVGAEVEVLPNTQFLVGEFNPYEDAPKDKNVVMEYFYRGMRKHHDLLMNGDEPEGGEWNYDKQNREPLPKDANPPDVPAYAPDEITKTVISEVAAYERAVGSTDGFNYAVTHAEAQQALDAFIRERLCDFGPYEDAMSEQHDKLWHSVLSPYLNIGLLTPMQVVDVVIEAYRAGDAPINSVEGFVRQVVGWREFMYWQYWRAMPDLLTDNAWDAQRPMPMFFWDGGQTEMNCLHHIVERVTETGYNHHIERLMVISNFCVLAGIEPQAVTDWFKAHYIDAYDWVMQTNVVGMGLNADGGKIATKPYIASANYINKMGDYCKGCKFARTKRHGENACPFNYLYWNFLIEHEDRLRSNPRLGPNVLGLRHLDDEERAAVQADAQAFLEGLEYYTE